MIVIAGYILECGLYKPFSSMCLLCIDFESVYSEILAFI